MFGYFCCWKTVRFSNKEQCTYLRSYDHFYTQVNKGKAKRIVDQSLRIIYHSRMNASLIFLKALSSTRVTWWRNFFDRNKKPTKWVFWFFCQIINLLWLLFCILEFRVACGSPNFTEIRDCCFGISCYAMFSSDL